MNQHEKDALDRYITGNYGEDQFRSKRFRDTRTGAVVTQFSILDIGFMEEMDDDDE